MARQAFSKPDSGSYSSAAISFEAKIWLAAGGGDYASAKPKVLDEYKAENVFRVLAHVRWSHLLELVQQTNNMRTRFKHLSL